jgi:3-hydroxybutyrate dehydrogenase
MLKGKSAIITGSTSGIGLGIAQALAKEGVNVTINGFGDAAEIEKTRHGIEAEFGVKVFYSGADMSKPEQVRQMVADGQATMGAVDILVNNAGIQHVQAIDDFDDAKWDAILAINLSSNFHAIKAAAKGMKTSGWGRIINVASVHGLVASPFKSAYIAAKHGAIGLTKAAALDLAEFGITVNAICPGYVDTPLVRKQIPQQAKEHGISEEEVIQKVMLKNHFVKKFVEVADLAAMAVFLCSDHGQTITGQAMVMDGGWTAH